MSMTHSQYPFTTVLYQLTEKCALNKKQRVHHYQGNLHEE